MPAQPSFPGVTATSSSTGFAGTGAGSYADLGITAAQAGLQLQVDNTGDVAGAYDTSGFSGRTAGAGRGTNTETVQQALSGFSALLASNSAEAAATAQQLYDAGLMPQSIYNSGATPNNADIYNAYKEAVLRAAAAHTPLGDFIVNATKTFQAMGGAKVKLPSVRYTVPLTSYDDMALAADNAFEKVLGHRAPDGLKQALTQELNRLETSGKTQEAQSAYSQLLGYRGLNPDGTSVNGGSQIANTALDGSSVAGQASNPQQMAQSSTVGGPAGLPQQVTNSSGQTETVSSGPIVTAYQAAPSPDALAYNTAMQSNPNEVRGRTIAAAMQAISQFVGQK